MDSFFTILLIGISLSMDAFSLALIYGMNISKWRYKIILSLIVGGYHFVMPIIGLQFGKIISEINFISIDIIAFLILMYIGIDLIISNYSKKEDGFFIGVFGFLMFGLSVSIDSLSLGIGLRAITTKYFMSFTIFSLTSCFFTYLGLIFGNIIGKKMGVYSKVIGGIILMIIAIFQLVK